MKFGCMFPVTFIWVVLFMNLKNSNVILAEKFNSGSTQEAIKEHKNGKIESLKTYGTKYEKQKESKIGSQFENSKIALKSEIAITPDSQKKGSDLKIKGDIKEVNASYAPISPEKNKISHTSGNSHVEKNSIVSNNSAEIPNNLKKGESLKTSDSEFLKAKKIEDISDQLNYSNNLDNLDMLMESDIKQSLNESDHKSETSLSHANDVDNKISANNLESLAELNQGDLHGELSDLEEDEDDEEDDGEEDEEENIEEDEEDEDEESFPGDDSIPQETMGDDLLDYSSELTSYLENESSHFLNSSNLEGAFDKLTEEWENTHKDAWDEMVNNFAINISEEIASSLTDDMNFKEYKHNFLQSNSSHTSEAEFIKSMKKKLTQLVQGPVKEAVKMFMAQLLPHVESWVASGSKPPTVSREAYVKLVQPLLMTMFNKVENKLQSPVPDQIWALNT